MILYSNPDVVKPGLVVRFFLKKQYHPELETQVFFGFFQVANLDAVSTTFAKLSLVPFFGELTSWGYYYGFE